MARSVVRWTADLVLVTLYAVAVAAVVIGLDPAASVLRTALVLPLVTFAPGYAIVALAYPDRYRREKRNVGRRKGPPDEAAATSGIPPLSRFLLSVAASIIVVPLVVLVENFVVGIYLQPVLLGVVAVTVVAALLALVARARVSTDDRFGLVVPWGGRRNDRRYVSQSRDSSATRLLRHPTVLLFGVSLVVLAGSVAVAAALPFAGLTAPQGEHFTEFYLTTENDSGEYVMDDYPSQFSPGESQPVHVTITNQEGETETYTVVAKLQRVEGGSVTAEEELNRFQREVGHTETVRVRHDLQPTMQGSNLRVVYLLYHGDAPSNPTLDNADRSTRLWVSVGGGQASVTEPTGEVTG